MRTTAFFSFAITFLAISVVSFLIFFLIAFWGIASASDDNYRECERYEAARIPQDMNPCWGSVKK